MDIKELAKEYRDLERLSEEAKKHLKEIDGNWIACEERLIDAMVEEGVNSLTLDGLGVFSLSTKNYLSVNAANKPAFYAYLKESGNGGLLREDVNPKTLNAFLKQHLDELIANNEEGGMDSVDARDSALKFLNDKGANYFSEKAISVRSGK